MRGRLPESLSRAAAALVLGWAAALSCAAAFAAAPEAGAATSQARDAEEAEALPEDGLAALPAYIRKRWGVDMKRAEEVVAAAQAAAARASVDPLLVLAIIAKESRFIHFGNPKNLAPDGKGEKVDPMAPHGPMQVAGRWHRDKMPRDSNGRIRPTSVKENIVAGTQVLREYLEHHGGNLRRALQQYNGCRGKDCDRYPNSVLGVRNELERAVGRGRED
ncbi:lytic transglycosylase domain-containing protein [Caldimonas tepidiphila]|uniref:lytic transglycosylase domain-containing protein n=1 Tax=Caldimonas tepidiphila TaxID=2315841 RepID=UPI000E5C4E38|nr:lytic transglycosylase domain-containing protein [Caldimonas tepidiphila]